MGQISREGEIVRVDARSMRLLTCLAERAGEVVSIDELLATVWPDVAVSSDSVYQAVTSLRRLLGDDPKRPGYIATVPRLGYRMVAQVGAACDAVLNGSSGSEMDSLNSQRMQSIKRNGRRWIGSIALCLLLIVLGAGILLRGRAAEKRQSVPQTAVVHPADTTGSIAVLPFLDLTEGMHNEEFADGMTEELIGRLSKLPGLRVTPPVSSFYFKGKQASVAEVAKALNVAYVLDGSVRKAGARVRVSARLIRADNGFVVWSESYDRPFGDILMVQDDIAGEVTKALKASMALTPAHADG